MRKGLKTMKQSAASPNAFTIHHSPFNIRPAPFGPSLKILHVDPERAWGGGQAQLVELCRHLGARGHRQTVACRSDGALRPRLPAAGVEILELCIRNDLDVG